MLTMFLFVIYQRLDARSSSITGMPLCSGCGRAFSRAGYTSHLRHSQNPPCAVLYQEALDDIPDSDAFNVDEPEFPDLFADVDDNLDLAANEEGYDRDTDEDGDIMFTALADLLPGSSGYSFVLNLSDGLQNQMIPTMMCLLWGTAGLMTISLTIITVQMKNWTVTYPLAASGLWMCGSDIFGP